MSELKGKTITPEALNLLPLTQFEGDIVVVEQEEHLIDVLAQLKNEKVLGFDTETKPSFKKGSMNRVSLIQLSNLETAYLIRIHKTGFSDALVSFLQKPDILKVGVGIRDDIRALQKIRSFEPGGFVELQNLARELGYEDTSLKKLAGLVLGARISKRQRLSNWELPELSASQLVYASTDAWIAIAIYKSLSGTIPCNVSSVML
jgi:ribonuclease D